MDNAEAAEVLKLCADAQQCTLFEVFVNVMEDDGIAQSMAMHADVSNRMLCRVAVVQSCDSVLIRHKLLD